MYASKDSEIWSNLVSCLISLYKWLLIQFIDFIEIDNSHTQGAANTQTHTQTTEIWNFFLKNSTSFHPFICANCETWTKNKQYFFFSLSLLSNYEVDSFLSFVWLIVQQFVKFSSGVFNFSFFRPFFPSLSFSFVCDSPQKKHIHTQKLSNRKRLILFYKTHCIVIVVAVVNLHWTVNKIRWSWNEENVWKMKK